MKEPSPLEKIEAHQKRIDDAQIIPDDVPLLEIADSVVRGKRKLSQQQSRMLIEVLPYVAPKLMAVAHFNGNDADLLDKALERRSMKLIEVTPVPMPTKQPEQFRQASLRSPWHVCYMG
jgi:hypothetical protein